MPRVWWEWWKVLPAGERQQWTLDPFVSAGPLRFEMSPAQAEQALSGITDDTQRYPRYTYGPRVIAGFTQGEYEEFGLSLYYWDERLDCVAVSARLGPQVLADGMRLAGQVPSLLEKWLEERAGAAPDSGEMECTAPGIFGSAVLGAYIDVQRAGDYLLSRPLLVSHATMDNAERIPQHVWSDCDPY